MQNLFVDQDRRGFLISVLMGLGGYFLLHPLSVMGQSKENKIAENSFSFKALREAGKINLAPPQFLKATDGIKLCYRRYVPAAPKATLLFIHGGGAHSGAGYQHLASGLQTKYEISVYTPDLRGHGLSEGPRGDAPSPSQVWEDITTCLKQIRADYPNLPLLVGGHSSGAGLALNYAGQSDHAPVAGYIFLSPQLGFRSLTDQPGQSAPFVKVDLNAFTAYFTSGGKTHGHDYAVKFNYPPELLEADPGMVKAITVHMSLAITPSAPREQFESLDRPFGIWIGSNDELFVPEKVLAFADLARLVRDHSHSGIIEGGSHLSVLLKAHETIGPFINSLAAKKNF
jgi:acylglycerol lipase